MGAKLASQLILNFPMMAHFLHSVFLIVLIIISFSNCIAGSCPQAKHLTGIGYVFIVGIGVRYPLVCVIGFFKIPDAVNVRYGFQVLSKSPGTIGLKTA